MPERSNVIKYPERPSMGTNYQIILFDFQIIYRYNREITTEFLPVFTIICADVNSRFGTDKEKFRSCRVLPDDAADLIFRIIPGDAFPVMTSVSGFIQIWTVVIQFVASSRKV